MLSRNIHKLSQDYLEGNAQDEQRRGGRFAMVGVRSSLGRVLDLSHCGAMIDKGIFRVTPSRDGFPIRIKFDDIYLTLAARVVRKTRVRGLGKVLGLEFIGVTNQQRDKIKQIITRSRRWNVLAEDQDAA